MCFITSESCKKDGSTCQLKVPQIIEALAYEKANARARIMLDCWVDNSGPDDAELLLVHPAEVSLEENNCRNLLNHSKNIVGTSRSKKVVYSQEDILFRIYQKRIDKDRGFLKRLNCYRQEDTSTCMDNDSAGLQFTTMKLSENGKSPNYTVIKVSGIKTGKTWFRVAVFLENKAYQQFVGEQPHFWIEGPSKVESFIKNNLENDIAMQDLGVSKEKEFFDQTVHANMIHPDAYDIVVFRKGVDGTTSDVLCDAITSDVYRAQIIDPIADELAYLYVSRSPDFWIDVCYADDPRLAPISETILYSDKVLHVD